MAETKAPRNKSDLDPVSERWRKLPWRQLEQHGYRIQKRIFKAGERGNEQAVRHLQKLLLKSRAARLIAVRRVTQVCKAWLQAGILTEGVFEPTEKGTPQGGVISPLLANIALHGMGTAVRAAFPFKEGKPNFMRYAADFVVLHPTEEGVIKARAILEAWLQDMGLELKPSKTRITHTLRKYQGTVGFDFLGFTVRHFLVGKTHSGRPGGMGKNALLGFKTIIKPSKEAIKQHLVETRQLLKKNNSAPQEKLMRDLNPVIRGWTYYYRPVAASETFTSCDYVVFHQLEAWATRRHPHNSKHWIMRKYWGVDKGEGWNFKTQETYLYQHTLTHIQRHVKVRRKASPYDGTPLYWSTRLRAHPAIGSTRGKVLQRQQGKCNWCGLTFKDGDSIELDHDIPRSSGGKNDVGNLMALHLHCHDQRHAHSVRGINENDHRTEEPDEGKAFTSGSEDA